MDQQIPKSTAPMPWEEVGQGIGVKSRKTVMNLVKLGHLKQVPGIRQVRIVRESYEAYVAGLTIERSNH